MTPLDGLRRFLIVVEATSAARFSREGIAIAETGEDYAFNASIATVYEDADLEAPLPRDVRVVVELEHRADLTTVSSIAGNWCNAFLNVVAVAMNAAVDEGLITYAVDRTDPGAACEFYQARDTRVPRRSVGTRAVHADATLAFFNALHALPEDAKGRLFRACQQYVLALRYWRPDSQALSLMHLAIAGETMRGVARDRVLADRALTKTELAARLRAEKIRVAGRRSASESALINYWIMTREIYHGDVECFEAVDAASNGFEHGYGEFADIKRAAAAYHDRAGRHIRRSIVELALPEGEHHDALLDGALSEPMLLWSALAVRGHVIDSRDPRERATPPLTALEQVVRSARYDAGTGHYTMEVGADVKAALGVEVTVERIDARS